MKIAIVHSFYREELPSGENTAVELQWEALRRAGHTVELFAKKTDELRTKPLYELASAYRVSTGYGGTFSGELERFQPEIVHVHNIFPNIGARWLKKVQVPIIATLHNYRSFCAAGDAMLKGNLCVRCQETGSHNAVINKCYQDSALKTIPLAIQNRKGFLENPLIAEASGLVLLSTRQEKLLSQFGLGEKVFRIIPNFVPENRHRTRVKNGKWLWVGRLSAEKGLEELLDWWPRSFELDIIGQGPLADLVRRNESAKIRFLGPKSPQQLAKVFPDYHGVIISSRPGAESAVNLVHLEALASGVPVIARIPSTSGDENLLTGMGKTYESREELLAALSQESSDPTPVEKIQKHFDTHYSEKRWVSQMEDFYREVLEKD
jgi:glycosyltransferase involved in cell wall biosynthesis